MTRLADLVFKRGYRMLQRQLLEFSVVCPHCEEYIVKVTSEFDYAYEQMATHAREVHGESVGSKNDTTNKG
jgi:hypothetical protein